MKVHFTEKDHTDIINLYIGGMYAKDIAKKYNVSGETILRILKKHNIEIKRYIRKSQFSDKDVQDMACLYDEGYSLKYIGDAYGVDESEIAFLFKKINKERRSPPRYHINENYFDCIDTQDKAYILGLFYADGYNDTKHNRIQLTLQEKDKHILVEILQKLDSDTPIRLVKKYKEHHKNCYWFTICNKHMSQTLASLGMVSGKSLILTFPKWLDKKLYSHFIRGYFDGDGHIDEHQGYRTNITSTESFCKSVQDILTEMDIESKMYNPPPYETTTRTLAITNKKNSKKFLDYLYKDAKMYLLRKFDAYIHRFA